MCSIWLKYRGSRICGLLLLHVNADIAAKNYCTLAQNGFTTSFAVVLCKKSEARRFLVRHRLEEDLSNGVDDAVGDLDVLLLELDTVDGGASRLDLERPAADGSDITAEG